MFGLGGDWDGLDNIITVYGGKIEALFALFIFVLSFFIIFYKNSSQLNINIKYALFAGCLFSIGIANFNKISYFLYFNF